MNLENTEFLITIKIYGAIPIKGFTRIKPFHSHHSMRGTVSLLPSFLGKEAEA